MNSVSKTPLPLFAVAAHASDRAGVDVHKLHLSHMRRSVTRDGAEALSDETLLELVFCRTLPHQEAATLAHRLLAEFGDFNLVMGASPQSLRRDHDVEETVIEELKLIEAATHRMARTRILNRPVLSSWEALISYCKVTMAHATREQFRVLYLDRKNNLIADEAQAHGTVDHVPVYPREVVKRALELNASALILVHNHPSGDPTPSDEDIAMTHRIREAARTLDITIHDHLVIGKGREVSFRSEGLL